MLVFSTNYLLEEYFRDFSLERWGISALSSIPPQMDRALLVISPLVSWIPLGLPFPFAPWISLIRCRNRCLKHIIYSIFSVFDHSLLHRGGVSQLTRKRDLKER